MIALVDYHKGNLLSVERGLRGVGAEVVVTDDPAQVAAADAVVLPGVGAFADAAASLAELGLVGALREAVEAGKPFLGICLGMHLMFEDGVEHALEGGPRPGASGSSPAPWGRSPAPTRRARPTRFPTWGGIPWSGTRRTRCSPASRRGVLLLHPQLRRAGRRRHHRHDHPRRALPLRRAGARAARLGRAVPPREELGRRCAAARQLRNRCERGAPADGAAATMENVSNPNGAQ